MSIAVREIWPCQSVTPSTIITSQNWNHSVRIGYLELWAAPICRIENRPKLSRSLLKHPRVTNCTALIGTLS